MSGWTITRMASRSRPLYKIVENDRFGQYPFVYAIEAWDKFILIDCGTGQHDLRSCVAQLNPRNLPYLLLLTHCHFDHIGGVSQFVDKPDCLDVCISASNKTFTQGFEINSLAMAHSGAKVAGFKVTRWLEENEIVYLDDSDKENPGKQIQTIWTPGHTPDSAAFWFAAENRLFIGDTIYPFTAVHLDCIGSNVNDFMASLKKLQTFIKSRPSGSAPEVANTDPSPVQPIVSSSPYETSISNFCSILGLERKALEKQFSLESLFQVCDGSTESAIEFYLSNSDSLAAICPPKATTNAPHVHVHQPEGVVAEGLMLSCGHVEENLEVSAVDKAIDMMTFIQAGAVAAQHVDGEYGEFCVDNFTLMMPLKPKWQ